VPPAQRISYDRESDPGHADVPPVQSSVLGRIFELRAPSGAPWKKALTMAMVAIMVVSAFVMLVPLAKEPASAPVDEKPARMLANEREVSYAISNIGDSYLKDSGDTALGRHGSTLGLNEWWNARMLNYSDTPAHDTYPFYVAYQPESGENKYVAGQFQHMPYGTYGFYRFAIEAKNLTTVATGAGKDPLYLPILGGADYDAGLAMDGGTVQLNWHFTYLTTQDKDNMIAGTHYANTYYGVVGDVLAPFGSHGYPNDGWYYEQTGTAVFDRDAAAKFLGLANPSTPLFTQFNTSNTPATPGDPGPMNTSWWDNYRVDGIDGGPYNIYAAYDYDIDTGPAVCYFLSVDPSSTADSLVLRIWGCTWGMEMLMNRYMDVQGLIPNFIATPEDFYFNATITPTSANITIRMDSTYHITTWKDADWWGPAYMLEAQHIDYNDIGNGWDSRFLDYMAVANSWKPTRVQYEPGANNYGVECAYVATPRLWNLAAGESLTVKLPTGPHMGYIPYVGTVSDTFPKNGGGNLLKVAEMNTHQMWGELVLGPGTLPSALYTNAYYDAANKMLTIDGPTTWARNANPHTSPVDYTSLDETGVPKFMFDVAKVSTYEMTFPGGTPTETGDYTLQVTAKNVTGDVVTDWNGTVDLAVTGPASIVGGVTTHTFDPGTDDGVWTTTLRITDVAIPVVVTSTDSLFTLDVTDSIEFTVTDVGIPEFPTMLMPVMVAAAMIVVFIRRRPKKDEE